jgi:2,3-bisphosphoglycerate-independent phosphoglycerate mutase
MDSLTSDGLSSIIDASGLSVGLPEGIMGNSEVGHLTMGAGRVSYQDLVRINKSLAEKSFHKNPVLLEACNRAKSTSNNRIHFLGLVSDGGVHSHIDHLKAFLAVAQEEKVGNSYVHFFADGRDTPPTSAPKYIAELQDYMKQQNYGSIATVIGRYFAMDRDKRWDRVKIAYEALTAGENSSSTSPDKLLETVENRHKANENDEFLKPIIVDKSGLIEDNDTLVFIDFRSDRMREIVSTFAAVSSVGGAKLNVDTKITRKNLAVIQMTQYDEKLVLPTIFPPQTMRNGLSEWLSVHEIPQFHTAETEKYAHITFFFNGGRELQFNLEERAMIASPKVATYDLQPEMSQIAVAESVVGAVKSGKYPFIMCNFAAPDMVGHTGVYEAAKKAVASCDEAIGLIVQACRQENYYLIVTADHGNAEEMEDEAGKPKTSHTTNYIPVIIRAPSTEQQKALKFTKETQLIYEGNQGKSEKERKPVGGLSNVAPTVLALMGLQIPEEMTGTSIIQPLK